MKASIKRKMIISTKQTISKIVLFFLYRGFKATYKFDENVKREIDSWENNFSIKLQVAPGGPSLCLKKAQGGLIRPKDIKKTRGGLIKVKDIKNPNIGICFKSIDSAFLVLTGRLGVSGAYAGHRFTLSGEISEAMSFVRCIDIVEAYLFPKFITKHILKEVPRKQANMLKTYRYVLFNF